MVLAPGTDEKALICRFQSQAYQVIGLDPVMLEVQLGALDLPNTMSL